MNLFKPSRHEQFLEVELVRVRAEHSQAMAAQKNTYEKLLDDVRKECDRLRDDNARLTRAAVPDMKEVVLPTDPVPPPPPAMPPPKPRTFNEYVAQEISSWGKEDKHQFIGVPGQPITPDKKPEETQNAGQDGKPS